MSSYRKVQPRHIARERAQPLDREGLGLLEKRKDYLKRYKRRKEREEFVNELERKAALRNPDEFYFRMVNVKRKDGKHIKKNRDDKEQLSKTIDEFDSKDLLYLKMRKAMEEKKISRLQSSLHFLRDLSSEELKQNIVYVDTLQEAADFDEEKYFDTPRPLLTRCYNLPRIETIKKGLLVNNASYAEEKEIERMERNRANSYAELAARMDRKEKIESAINEIELKRQMAKNKDFCIIQHDDNTKECKWKTKRLK